jgi:myo-inositol-1(or 4)-monophosphatase
MRSFTITPLDTSRQTPSYAPRHVEARHQDLRRIADALAAASALIPVSHDPGDSVERKERGDPVTEADRAVDRLLRMELVRDGEGWLSEETADDGERLRCARLWVVDPLDGTREYITGIPEWCISIALIENEDVVAGGICNPATGETFIGSRETGLTASGSASAAEAYRAGSDGLVLASRSEYRRGEWARVCDAPFRVRPVGSVAYKLALVAAGYADATWTLVPKHEWDVAAGVALVLAAGGTVKTLAGTQPRFNQPKPLLNGLFGISRHCHSQVRWKDYLPMTGH